MNRLLNKVAIVTGAAGGIGKAMALLFAREGAKVLATDLQDDKLNQWVAEAGKLEIIAVKHDVSSEADWDSVIAKVKTLYGQLDILVNNAGVYPPGATMENTSLADWERLLSVDLNGPFLGTKACIPLLAASGKASVINISSIAGIVGGNGPAYTASKGALRLLTKDNAVELAQYNIRVNSIHPGGVLTPMTDFLVNTADSAELMKSMCPMGRIGDAMEIAYGALFLASDEASYITGAELVIDGGLTAR